MTGAMDNAAGQGATAADDAAAPLSLSERIYRSLCLSLMSGRYAPGQQLNISRLAEEFQTSPTPVREAIFQLVRKQALEWRAGYHVRVPVLSARDHDSLRITCVPLERMATELATARLTEADHDRLVALHQAFAQAEADEDWDAAVKANYEFHFLIYDASGNPVLINLIRDLWLMLGPSVRRQYPALRNTLADPHPHNVLVDALRRGAAVEAGDAAVADLREGSYRARMAVKAAAARAKAASAAAPASDAVPASDAGG